MTATLNKGHYEKRFVVPTCLQAKIFWFQNFNHIESLLVTVNYIIIMKLHLIIIKSKFSKMSHLKDEAGTKDLIKKHEGVSNIVYPDTKHIQTIGIGHKITRDEAVKGTHWTPEQVEDQFQTDFNKAVKGAENVLQQHGMKMEDLSRGQQSVIVDMTYNMGETGVGRFHKMFENLKAGDTAGASKELLNSNYADQVKGRATENAHLLQKK